MRNTDLTNEQLEPIAPRRGNHFSSRSDSAATAADPAGNATGVSAGSAAPQSSARRPASPSETAEYASAYFQSAQRKAPQTASASHGTSAAAASGYTPTAPSAGRAAANQAQPATQAPRPQQAAQPIQAARASQTPLPSSGGNGGGRGTGHNTHHSSYYNQQPPRKRGRGKLVAGIIGAIFAFIVVVGGVCGFFMLQDYRAITTQVPTLMEEAGTLKDSVMAGDGETVRNTAADIASKVTDMHNRLGGIPWQIASFVPVLGQDVRSVRTVVDQADNLCQYALIPACDDLGNIKLSNLLEDGVINVDLFTSLANTLSQVAPVVQQSAETIEDLPEPVIDRLREPIQKAKDLMGTADEAVTKLNEMAPYLPEMLGANGETRNYLIIAQSNAELRSTGGFPGAAGVMTVVNGSINLGDFSSFASMDWYDTPGFGVTEEELTIFGDGAGNDNRIGRIPADTNIIPDFARACEIISAMWTDQHGGTIDGIIAIDPVFLQNMLALTGGFTTSSGIAVDGTNAAALLLHDAYNTFSTSGQDQFFAEVAGNAFSQLTSSLGGMGFTDLLNAITTGIEESRLQVWMADPDEETLMVEMGCDGAIPNDPTNPELGVYASDDTYSKIAWYLSLHTTVNSLTKNMDGTTTYNVTTTLTNNLDPYDAYNQVEYITGYNTAKRNQSDMIDKVYLFAPAGGTISDVYIDGYVPEEFPLKEGTYNGSQVWYVTLQTSGLETSTLTYNVTTSADAAELAIHQTPTAQSVAGWQ